MPDNLEVLSKRHDELRNKISIVETNLAIQDHRIGAMELKQESILMEAAESRAENRQSFAEVMNEIRQIRDNQKFREGIDKGESWLKEFRRWIIPILITAFLTGKAKGWW